jgi:hypothetical protein
MTTGRINQITHLQGTRRLPREAARAHSPRRGRSSLNGRDARSVRPQRLPRRTRGDVDDHPIAPTKPLSAGPHAGIQPGRPLGRGLAAAYGPRVEGPDPVDNAGERRIPRGGSPQESKCQVWPAAIRPQTPAVPGTKRPPGFGRHSDTPRLTRYDPWQPQAVGRHGRAPRGTLRTHLGRPAAGEGRADAERSCSRRSPPVLVPGPRRHSHQNQKGDLSCREDCRGERSALAFTHTHRPRSGGRPWCKR